MDQFGNYKGETMIPEEDSAYDFHLARYQWAASFLPLDSSVLDVGCGIGYGSKPLLEKCGKYTGFDKYPCRKERAEFSYPDNRSTFLTFSANDIFPFIDNSFDGVVCFEAIEHIEKDYFVISEIYRVLKTGGVFVCSTPILRLQKGHYHIREYSVKEFQDLIAVKFSDISWYGQGHNKEFLLGQLDSIYICCVAKK